MIPDAKLLELMDIWAKRIKSQQLKPRAIADKIASYTGKEIIDLVGVRRSGKSSTLFLVINKLGLSEDDYIYMNFEDPLFINNCNIELLERIWDLYNIHRNPKGKPYLFLDEIQLIPMWERWLRRFRDLELAHIFVTGSSSKLMSREYGTSLTGRHLSHKIFPLTFKEFVAFHGQKIPQNEIELIGSKIKMKRLLNTYFELGGFPEVSITRNIDLLKDYFEDILYKDIIVRHEIRDVNSLRKLAVFCLTNISNPITYNSLRKQFSLSLDTVRSYLSYLEESLMIFQIPFYSYSLKVQEASPKKIYCVDHGLRNAVSATFSKDLGRIVENIVFLTINAKADNLYYWKNKNEVDFVFKEKDGVVNALNVTYSDEIPEREIKGLLEFKEKHKSKSKIKLTIITKDTDMKEHTIQYVPLWKWLLES